MISSYVMFSLQSCASILSLNGDINLGIFTEGNLMLTTSQPSTWDSQRGALLQCHQIPQPRFSTAPLKIPPALAAPGPHAEVHRCVLSNMCLPFHNGLYTNALMER